MLKTKLATVSAALVALVLLTGQVINPGATLPDYPINVAGFLTPSQLAAVKSGVNTTDVSAAIAGAISACPTAGCKLYFPAGYYYSASCNFSLANPFALVGDGGRSIDGTQYVSVIACGANSVPLFTASALTGLFKDIALISVGFTPAAGSSSVLAKSTTSGLQKVDYENISVDGFYDAIDVATGQNWRLVNSLVQNTIHWGLRIRNTILPDAGGCWVHQTQFNMNPLAAAGIRYESGGGCTLDNNAIISQSNTPIVDGISIDFTGITTQQIVVINNQIDFVSNYALNIVKGVNQVSVAGNYFGCGHSSATACVFADSVSFSVFGPNRFVFGSQTNSYSIAHSQWVTVLPSPMQGLPLIWGASAGPQNNDVDMTTFVPPVNLTVSTFDPRTPGLTLAPVDTLNNAHGSEFQVNAQVTVSVVELVVGVQSGNISAGIYDNAAHQWIATTGTVACPAGGVRDINFSASVTLYPGKKYTGYIAADNTTMTFLAAVQAFATSSTDNLNVFSTSMMPIPASGNLANSHVGLKAPILSFF